MGNYKVDKSPNSENMKKERDVLKTKGKDGAQQVEPIPNFNNTEKEAVLSHANAWIVLGGDRPASPKSGKAGQGSTQSSAMDIVVGRGQNIDGEPDDRDKTLDPNFFQDAARVYLTQKGDVDTYFGIAKGVFGDFMSTEKKSASVMKADHVRLVAREGIKLVTGKGKNAGGGGEKNSLGQEPAKVPPIEFIAGNYTDPDFLPSTGPKILQPLIKGENLVEYLLNLQGLLGRVMGMVQANTNDLMIANGTLAGLTAIPAPPVSAIHVTQGFLEFNRTTALTAEQQNLASLQINYLEPVGKIYINSNHVYTT